MVLIEQDIALGVSRDLNARVKLLSNTQGRDSFDHVVDKHKHLVQQTKPIFDNIIENSGQVYGPILAQCKQRYDTYIRHITQKQAAKRISADLKAQRLHEASAIEIYVRRHAELNRKIEILKQKHQLSIKELESWRSKSFKLKLKPDVIETDPDQALRELRDFQTTVPPNYHAIPGLNIDKLSLDYTTKLKQTWADRVERQKQVFQGNFVHLDEFKDLKTDFSELETQHLNGKVEVSNLKSKIGELRQFLNVLRASGSIRITTELPRRSDSVIESLPETYQEDSQLIHFWEYLQEDGPSGGLKAVSLALCNRRFYVAGTMAIFVDYDNQRLKLDPYEHANVRAFNADSTALQFARGLNRTLNYSREDVTVEENLTDFIVELLREEARDEHFSRVSCALAKKLTCTGCEKDRLLAAKIYIRKGMINEYFQSGGDDYKILADNTVQVHNETWSATISRHCKNATQSNLKKLQLIYQIWYRRRQDLISAEESDGSIENSVGALSACRFVTSISNKPLRDAFVKSMGGWRNLMKDDYRDWNSSKVGKTLQSEHVELLALVIIDQILKQAFNRINEHEKTEFDFYV